jgi:Right handed beta helix region
VNTVRFVAALLVAIVYTAGTPLVPEVTDGTQRQESARQEVPTENTEDRSAPMRPRQSVETPEPTCQPTPPLATAPNSQPSAERASPAGASPVCGPDGTAGIVAITPPRCTMNVTRASQVNSAKPGETICVKGNVLAGSQLNITASGTARAPITITGEGDTPVKGIRVNASSVVVQGFTVIGAAAPGVQLKGNNLTLQSTKIDHPTGGDYDGIRFFGDNIKILHNHIVNITNTGGAHADCMQTFATTTPTSRNVLISGNRCEKIDNQCLIAQGPHSKAGDGSGRGESSGLTFTNNYCDAHASQAVHIDDFQNATVMSNDIQGTVRKAFNLINRSTGAKLSCNKLGPGVETEAIIDRSSRSGYQGPREKRVEGPYAALPG